MTENFSPLMLYDFGVIVDLTCGGGLTSGSPL